MGQRAHTFEKPPRDADAGWRSHVEDLCRVWNRGSWPFTFSRVHDALQTGIMYRHCFWALEVLRARPGYWVGNFWASSWPLLALLMADPGEAAGALRGWPSRAPLHPLREASPASLGPLIVLITVLWSRRHLSQLP